MNHRNIRQFNVAKIVMATLTGMERTMSENKTPSILEKIISMMTSLRALLIINIIILFISYYDSGTINLLIASAISSIAMIGISAFIELSHKPHPDIGNNDPTSKIHTSLNYQFIFDQSSSVSKSIFIISLSSLIYLYISRDEYSFRFALFIMAMLFVFLQITKYRVNSGYFGSNADEAMDLIGYILDRGENGDPPNSSRVSDEEKSVEHVVSQSAVPSWHRS